MVSGGWCGDWINGVSLCVLGHDNTLCLFDQGIWILPFISQQNFIAECGIEVTSIQKHMSIQRNKLSALLDLWLGHWHG